MATLIFSASTPKTQTVQPVTANPNPVEPPAPYVTSPTEIILAIAVVVGAVGRSRV